MRVLESARGTTLSTARALALALTIALMAALTVLVAPAAHAAGTFKVTLTGLASGTNAYVRLSKWTDNSANGFTQIGGKYSAGGSASFPSVGAGMYKIEASADGYRAQSVLRNVAETPAPLSLPMSSLSTGGATVSGRVLLPSGAPAANVRVTASLDYQSNRTVTTSADGRYTFTTLRAGYYTLRMNAPSASTNALSVYYGADRANGISRATVTVPASGTLALKDARLAPAAMVGVKITGLKETEYAEIVLYDDNLDEVDGTYVYPGEDGRGLWPTGVYRARVTVRDDDTRALAGIPMWIGGGFSEETAATVTLVTGRTYAWTLPVERRNRIWKAPSVLLSGKKAVLLQARWSAPSPVKVTQVWRQGKRVIGRGTSVKLSKAVLKRAASKKALRKVTVTVSGASPRWGTASAVRTLTIPKALLPRR